MTHSVRLFLLDFVPVAFAFSACSSTKPADLVLRGGKVATVDADFSIQQAVAVSDGRIVFERSFGYRKWFKDLHPVISENEFRRELGIVKVLLKRYGQDGKLLHDTFQDYSPETGKYIYGECRFPYANPGSGILDDMYVARY